MNKVCIDYDDTCEGIIRPRYTYMSPADTGQFCRSLCEGHWKNRVQSRGRYLKRMKEEVDNTPDITWITTESADKYGITPLYIILGTCAIIATILTLFFA